jgi:uncharacterized protein (TIGR02588 family)
MSGRGRKPVLEWIAASIGLVLTIALLGFIGWNAIQQQQEHAPAISVRIEGIAPSGNGWLVRFAARNAAPSTAAAVRIEGELRRTGADAEISAVTLDYLPGGSELKGGLMFAHDPRRGRLTLRPLGYVEP